MATISLPTLGSSEIELPLRQFDAKEYIAMAEAGVFEARDRVELLGGYVIDMSPANSDHNFVVMRFNELFAPLLNQFKIWVQGTLGVDQRNVIDPDFMLLKPREQSYKLALPTPVDVALLVEVAGSSLQRDARVKLPIYAAHGIADYWIADLDREVLIVHRQPRGDQYGEVLDYSGDARISALAAPGLSISVDDMFSPS